jgi:hypothetical protein
MAKRVSPNIDEAVEVDLAQVLRSISESLSRLTSSGLTNDAVIALVHDDTNLPKGQIRAILRSLGSLAEKYTRAPR